MNTNDDSSQKNVSRDLAADLSSLRAQIDQVDDQLLVLLNKRSGLALQIGRHKSEMGYSVSIFQPEREMEILERLCARNTWQNGCLPIEHIESIWHAIFSSSKALQAGTTGDALEG